MMILKFDTTTALSELFIFNNFPNEFDNESTINEKSLQYITRKIIANLCICILKPLGPKNGSYASNRTIG